MQTVKRQHLDQLWAYIAGVCRGCGSKAIIVGGEPDHVHVLCTLPRTESTSSFVEQVKRNSSHWIKSLAAHYQHFAWQRGYAVFSVSQSKIETTKSYIASQEEHHKKTTFREEYEQWLAVNGIEYDAKYLWTD